MVVHTYFLANLGPLAEHGTRATWIRNLLAAGGIDAESNDGFTNSADAGKAFAESGFGDRLYLRN